MVVLFYWIAICAMLAGAIYNVWQAMRFRRELHHLILVDMLMSRCASAMIRDYLAAHPPIIALPAWAATMGQVAVEVSISRRSWENDETDGRP